MALYTSESKERVREAVDFLELVGARTELRRAGPTRYEGLCPFHDERTPSFGIDPVQKVYHCFGCQASGDVFTFVQETEGVDFKEALELLAERCGVELVPEREDPREEERRRSRGRLLELVGRTASYYARYLWESAEAHKARAYLAERGLGEQILREFGVGYAPSAWDRVLLASRRSGFSEQELFDTGLAQRSKQDGRPYDRFRGRIMFPLADIRGRVLGFGARAMREDQRPKYLNTADNAIYHKGSHLFGAHLARAHGARAGQVILCEGYTDAIALHQAGMRNAVGLMGTALTDEQVAELARMAHTVLLALDADSAGQEAMLRSARVAARRRLELRVVELPAGTDPAELIRRDGPEAMTVAVENAVPFIRFRVERVLQDGDDSSAEGRDRMLEELRPLFAELPESAMRMELTRLVSNRLALPDRLAEKALSAVRGGSGGRPAVRPAAGSAAGGEGPLPSRVPSADAPRQDWPAAELQAREETERAFLALCVASPQEGAGLLEAMDLEQHFASPLVRRAAARLRAGDLADPMKDPPGAVALEDDPQLKELLAELIVGAGREHPDKAMLEVQRLQLELAGVEREIQQAWGSGGGEISRLARRKAEIKQEFDQANERVLEESANSTG
ncbi:MAG TPA: DNA primase [Solirubrobacteraceae bacterium]|nr:DNA primase [Solirubrobacteraceae bacterium]